MTLKRVEIPDFGPFVFGRIPSRKPTYRATPISSVRVTPPAVFAPDYDAIRSAAAFLHPIYNAEENILGNDRYGDCTCAGAHHLQAVMTASTAGATWRLPTAMDALWTYSQVTQPPFVLSSGANDNGADLMTVMQFWQSHGIFQDGTGKINSWAPIDATNADAVKVAIATNKNLYLGTGLPEAWLQTPGPVWDVAGPSVGSNGHCIVAYGYDKQGVFVDSWGKFIVVTWAALAKYFSGDDGEAYSVVAA